MKESAHFESKESDHAIESAELGVQSNVDVCEVSTRCINVSFEV